MRAVIAPKLNAMEHLGRLSHAAPVASFVLFSSISSVVGFSGHTNYCAANATLDVYAKQDALCGLPILAVQWGAWSAVGETALHKIGYHLIVQCKNGLELKDTFYTSLCWYTFVDRRDTVQEWPQNGLTLTLHMRNHWGWYRRSKAWQFWQDSCVLMGILRCGERLHQYIGSCYCTV